MRSKAAITVNHPRDEIERLWRSAEHRPSYIAESDAAVTFTDAPGDRGTEIHVDLESTGPAGKVGDLVRKVSGDQPALAKVKDDLRHFKQLAETGVIARSDGVPEGETVARKLKQRPAQPLSESELQEVGS